MLRLLADLEMLDDLEGRGIDDVDARAVAVGNVDAVDVSADGGAESGADRSAILDVQQLGGGKAVTGRRKLTEVSFRLKPGEVLGLTGLVGAGRSTLLRCLFGLERTDEGRMTLLGEGYSPTGVSTAVESGVVLIPEDRRDQGIFAGLSIEEAAQARTRVGRMPR